jgi:preprotein translocase subunit YajC
MFITPAFAQAAGGAAGGPSAFLIQIVPFAAILLIFYFLIIRPQQQRLKQHRELVSSVKRNDMVVTAGGIVGKVTKINEKEGADAEVEVEIAPNTRVMVVRSTLSDVRRAKETEEK